MTSHFDAMGRMGPHGTRPLAYIACCVFDLMTTLRLCGTCPKRPRCPTSSTCRPVQSPPSTRTSVCALVVCGAPHCPPLGLYANVSRRATGLWCPCAPSNRTSSPVLRRNLAPETSKAEARRANRWASGAGISARVESRAVLPPIRRLQRRPNSEELRPLKSVAITTKISGPDLSLEKFRKHGGPSESRKQEMALR